MKLSFLWLGIVTLIFSLTTFSAILQGTQTPIYALANYSGEIIIYGVIPFFVIRYFEKKKKK